ncbi:uncharacterized protein LOC128548060 [Mercenaria mercenaria]|uniref:uncharacterized protein LOC128548060 n=1 Tax=Mercenaria mercenaria TaxID=6596 RepID=UPI00234F96C9|nr:uncharacterized protein LOC128548060 [Mercenaria mercenaria]
MFSAILLSCLFVFIQSVDLNMADSSLVCNRGIYMHNKIRAVFRVSQENCLVPAGSCEDCFQQCVNYTDIVGKFKMDVSGLFNVSWMMNGRETTYLMEYGIQLPSGILQISYAFLTFSGLKKFSMKGWYSVILQCKMTDFARVRITLRLPNGNRSTDIYPVTFSTASTKMVSSSVSVPLAEETQSHVTEPINEGIIVAIVLAGTITIFIVVAVIYMRKAIKTRNDEPKNNTKQTPTDQVTSESIPERSFSEEHLPHGNDSVSKKTPTDVIHNCTEPFISELPVPVFEHNSDHQCVLENNFMSHDYHNVSDQHNGLELVPHQHRMPHDIFFPHHRHQHAKERTDEIPPYIQMQLQSINSEP